MISSTEAFDNRLFFGGLQLSRENSLEQAAAATRGADLSFRKADS